MWRSCPSHHQARCRGEYYEDVIQELVNAFFRSERDYIEREQNALAAKMKGLEERAGR
jgi:hypothetical protein